MSDTPRVDSYVYKFPGCQREPRLIDFARQLELELAEARAENVRLAKTMQLAIAINSAMQESSYDMPDLRGHECLAKHKLLSLFDLWRKKVRPRLPGFVDDEISKRDKLVEQMREALKAAAETIHFLECERGHNFGNLLHGDLLPALEAAERMRKK